MKQLPITESFLSVNNEGHLIPNMPLELSKGFQKKRIDHRHHAMDAIVIACATRSHIQYLNNESAKTENHKLQAGLAKQLCSFKEVEFKKKVKDENGVWVESEEKVKKVVPDKFLKPWDSFTTDAKQALENIIVSFKQNLRVINKTTNYYESYKDENGDLRMGKNGKPEKGFISQQQGDSWAIRKSMHKDTVFGEVNLRRKDKPVPLDEALKNPNRIVNKEFKQKIRELLSEGHDAKFIKKYVEENKDIWSDIDIAKINVYYYTQDVIDENGRVKERFFATRKALDTSFDKKKIEDSLTDTGIQEILSAHLKKYDRLCFSCGTEYFEILINGRINNDKTKYSKNDIDIQSILEDPNNRFYYKEKELESNDLLKEDFGKEKKNFDEFKSYILNSEKLVIEIKEHPEIAFSPDGIDEMNRIITDPEKSSEYLKKGKIHQPIFKVRIYEQSEKKFAIGKKGNKRTKFVEADDGTNLFFAVYQKNDGERTYATIPFEISIECQKEGAKDWIDLLDERLRNKSSDDEKLNKYLVLDIPQDAKLLFVLSVNDLVYVPSNEELNNGVEKVDTNRIYKTVSFNKKQCFCIKHNVATSIVNKVEFSSSNKMERAITGEMIKETCIPIKVDRLGNIIELNGKKL